MSVQISQMTTLDTGIGSGVQDRFFHAPKGAYAGQFGRLFTSNFPSRPAGAGWLWQPGWSRRFFCRKYYEVRPRAPTRHVTQGSHSRGEREGEFRILRALIDTGAEANLIRKGALSSHFFQISDDPSNWSPQMVNLWREGHVPLIYRFSSSLMKMVSFWHPICSFLQFVTKPTFLSTSFCLFLGWQSKKSEFFLTIEPWSLTNPDFCFFLVKKVKVGHTTGGLVAKSTKFPSLEVNPAVFLVKRHFFHCRCHNMARNPFWIFWRRTTTRSWKKISKK